MKDIKERIKNILIFALSAGALYLFLMVIGVGCPIKFFTGISCPGCGMTRAWLCLLHLDVHGAFHYHPLFILPIPAVLLMIFDTKLSKKLYNTAMFTFAVFFAIIYTIRLMDPSDDIVVFDPLNGFIGRMILFLKDHLSELF